MIEAVDVFQAFQPYRGDAIVSVTGVAGRHWSSISTNEKRDVTLGGAMGQTTSAAFGLALGLPDEKVVLFDSEGALLMNLGVLATIAGKRPENFFHFLLDNECYATTGGQPVPQLQRDRLRRPRQQRWLCLNLQLRRSGGFHDQCRRNTQRAGAGLRRGQDRARDRKPPYGFA